ncbi:hypothetical protein V1515DRAFT_597993 [Lipomyces mesembrius]
MASEQIMVCIPTKLSGRSSYRSTLRLQSQFNVPILQPQEIAQALSNMRGIEFAIALAHRLQHYGLFASRTEFFHIYMASTAFSVIPSRMLTGVRELRLLLSC